MKILNTREQQLTNLIQVQKSVLSSAPDGRLRCKEYKKHFYFFHMLRPGDSTGKYIPRKQQSLAAALAQKDYAHKIIHSSEKELSCLRALITHYNMGNNPESIFEKLNTCRRSLVNPIELSSEQFADKWKKVTFTPKEHKEDLQGNLITANGEYVRSKSELLIVDTLARLGIPYRYECPLDLFGLGIIYPDFTVLNITRRKEMIWEHLGMMDDPQYAHKAINRINHYIREGFYPGDSLILTYETKANPLHTKLIDEIATHYLMD